MRTISLCILGLGALGALPACGGHSTYVQAEKAALGRVVIYRNGVAFYERRARTSGDRLNLRVPGDKVDDFLKSLTIVDAQSGQALPVSFPSKGYSGVDASGHVQMSVQLPTSTPRDLILSYVTDAPAWKPSYRVVIDREGKVQLQGWAIVDNTSGEDWQAVKVGVGSSSALSFRYDLHSIRHVHRETLQSQDTFAKAPPRGGSIVRTENNERVLGELSDRDIPQQAGYPGGGDSAGLAASSYGGLAAKKGARALPGRRLKEEAAPAAQAQQAPAVDDSRLRSLAQSLRQRRGPVVIEGYADANEPADKALERANLLRNQLIMNGVAPTQLQVNARGVVQGQRAGVRILEPATPAGGEGDAKKPGAPEDGPPVGESHFESSSPMTVARGTSAMVSIVQGGAQGEVVYLYDPEGSSGDARFAFRAVRFKNPTGSTLESGPVTVYGEGRFIGEGLTDAIPAGSGAVVPFALDRQVLVERDGSSGDRIARLVKLVRGVLTAEVQHSRRTRLKIQNRLGAPVTVLVRHSVRSGWTLVKGPKVAERYGEAHLFQVALKPYESQLVDVEEATPMTRTLDLRTPTGAELVKAYLEGAPSADKDAELQKALARLVDLQKELARHEEAMENLRQRGDEYRVRLDELHGQIVTLQAVKTGGALMQHLQTKMREISQKVQENTIALVDLKEKAMVARVRFQDGLSELSLERTATAAR